MRELRTKKLALPRAYKGCDYVTLEDHGTVFGKSSLIGESALNPRPSNGLVSSVVGGPRVSLSDG